MKRIALVASILLAFAPEARSVGGPSSGSPWIYRKGQTRVMPLGDSITNAPGWRLDLQGLREEAGY